ncbi:MAG: TlpA family protein disulfide reductase [Actinomycetota bacterium]|nr:TlpA family protein disulfide reductase [Actinomycetota bacterium]
MADVGMGDGSGGGSQQNDQRPQRRTSKYVLAAAGLVGVVALVAVALSGTSATSVFDPAAEPTAGLGPISGPRSRPLPLRTLPAFGDGEPVALEGYVGKPLLVNFWATWCAPCVREMPMLRHMSEEMAGQVAFLGVNVQDSPTQAAAFLQELDVAYDQASDPQAEYFRAVGGFGMPTTLLVDRDGVVQYQHTGELTAEQLASLLRAYLDVSPK